MKNYLGSSPDDLRIKSFAATQILSALNLTFPGIGLVINMIFGKLFGGGDEDVFNHFRYNVIEPLINGVQSKNYSGVAPIVSIAAGGDPKNVYEHVGFIHQYARSAMPAVYSAVIGDALLQNDLNRIIKFAQFIDNFDNVAVSERLRYEQLIADRRAGKYGARPASAPTVVNPSENMNWRDNNSRMIG